MRLSICGSYATLQTTQYSQSQLIKKRFDALEKHHWNTRRKWELAKGNPMLNKYDTIKYVGEELVLLYYRGELVIKHDLDELAEYYFRNMFSRICPEGV